LLPEGFGHAQTNFQVAGGNGSIFNKVWMTNHSSF